MLERPTTTARFAREIAEAVLQQQEAAERRARHQRPGRRWQDGPALTTWKPSTSLSGSMALSTAWGSICLGSGSCTRMPLTAGSLLRRSTRASSSTWPVVSGELVLEGIHARFASSARPCSSHRPCWRGSRPRATTASPGVKPCFACSVRTCSAMRRRRPAAKALPSMIFAVGYGPPRRSCRCPQLLDPAFERLHKAGRVTLQMDYLAPDRWRPRHHRERPISGAPRPWRAARITAAFALRVRRRGPSPRP